MCTHASCGRYKLLVGTHEKLRCSISIIRHNQNFRFPNMGRDKNGSKLDNTLNFCVDSRHAEDRIDEHRSFKR